MEFARDAALRLKCLAPRSMARATLICLPFAGAGVSAFRGWGERLPGTVEAYALQAPGREDLLAAPPMTNWASVLAATVAAIEALPRRPVALYGHSLGALLALDLACGLHCIGANLQHVFVSARPWPGLPAVAENPLADPAGTADEDLLAHLAAAFGPLPPTLRDPEIASVVLPIVRADLRLLGSYHYKGPAGLAAPLTVYAGANDPSTNQSDLSLWAAETAGAFDIVRLEAGHYFVETCREQLTTDIGRRLGC